MKVAIILVLIALANCQSTTPTTTDAAQICYLTSAVSNDVNNP